MSQRRSELVVVPCGKSKIWDKNPRKGSTKAKDVYLGVPFTVNREYAEKYGEKWVILSAKYGLIEPDYVIPENYNVTFNDPETNPISVNKLQGQVKDNFSEYMKVLALGSTKYSEIVRKAFSGTSAVVCSPVAGLPIGKALGKVKTAIRLNKPFQF